MFDRVGPGTISSDEGFVVKIGRPYITYQEGIRSVKVESDTLVKPLGAVLYPSSVKRWDPDGQAILDADRAKILENIQRAFAFAGYVCEIQQKPD